MAADAPPPARDLNRLLRPKRVAVIGASERNPFSAPVIRNLQAFGFRGEVLLVNPKGEPVAGRPTLRSAADLDGEVDAAFVCVPSSAVIEVVAQAADAGVKGFIVVASGFAETGDAGAKAQEALADIVRTHRIPLLGPNALGFMNYVDGAALCVLERANARGSLGIASVSGSVGAYIAKTARQQGIGLSHMVLAGNEADVTIADVLDFLVDDPDTGSIAVFLETVYDPQRFSRAAERARLARKPIVLIKAGSCAATAPLVAAHTGALVGDNRVFDAVAREMGICRVDSYEDLISTATLLEKTGPTSRSGVAALTLSGGSGEILSDLAGAAGVSFPPFSAVVKSKIDTVVSGFGAGHNPLDVTGAALADVSLWEKLLAILAEDEAVGLTLCLWDVPGETDALWMVETLNAMSRGYRAHPAPPPLIAPTREVVTDHGLQAIMAAGLPGVITGLKPAVVALAHHRRWSERVLDPCPVGLHVQVPAETAPRPVGERALLDWLDSRGVPVTPGLVAADADAAVAAARGFGYPVALKLASPDVAHKSDVGGVKLGLTDEAAVRSAFAAIAAAPVGPARVEGVTVSPMRAHSVELIVSMTNDRHWGPMLALGLGGVWVEVMKDSALLPLPVDGPRIKAALRDLKGAPLLEGERGRDPIDLDVVAAAVVAIAEAALDLGPELTVLEINPLAVSTDRAEAMDALAVWKS